MAKSKPPDGPEIYNTESVISGMSRVMRLALAQADRSFRKLGVREGPNGSVILDNPEKMDRDEERFHQAVVLTVSKQILPSVQILQGEGGDTALVKLMKRLSAAVEDAPDLSPAELYVEATRTD